MVFVGFENCVALSFSAFHTTYTDFKFAHKSMHAFDFQLKFNLNVKLTLALM